MPAGCQAASIGTAAAIAITKISWLALALVFLQCRIDRETVGLFRNITAF